MPVTSTLYDSPAEIVGKLLIDLGLCSDPNAGGTDWPVYQTDAPDLPDNLATVYDTSGIGEGRTMPDGEPQTHYGFMIWLRGKDHTTGWRKMDTIYTALTRTDAASPVRMRNVTISGRVYTVYCVARVGDIIPTGKETPTSRRRIFTLNATLSVDRRS